LASPAVPCTKEYESPNAKTCVTLSQLNDASFVFVENHAKLGKVQIRGKRIRAGRALDRSIGLKWRRKGGKPQQPQLGTVIYYSELIQHEREVVRPGDSGAGFRTARAGEEETNKDQLIASQFSPSSVKESD
jgi:hypothetical protein